MTAADSMASMLLQKQHKTYANVLVDNFTKASSCIVCAIRHKQIEQDNRKLILIIKAIVTSSSPNDSVLVHKSLILIKKSTLNSITMILIPYAWERKTFKTSDNSYR